MGLGDLVGQKVVLKVNSKYLKGYEIKGKIAKTPDYEPRSKFCLVHDKEFYQIIPVKNVKKIKGKVVYIKQELGGGIII